MDAITELTKFDFLAWVIGTLLILTAVKYGASLIAWVGSFFGIEFKWARKQKEEHDLLVQTAQNLTELQKRHEEDVTRSITHDKEIETQLVGCVEDIKNMIQADKKDTHDFIENRLVEFYSPYREQSKSIQHELVDAQNRISETLIGLSNKIDTMQKNTDERFRASEEKQNKRVRAELKDKIGQSYRMYSESGKITAMELEALEGLIEAYEAAEGDNSFVHSVVQKEMYTWEHI